MRAQAAALHRAGCNDRSVQDVAYIEIAVAAVSSPVVRILVARSSYVPSEVSIADAVGPRIIGEHRKVVAQTLIDGGKQRVVSCVCTIIDVYEVPVILTLARYRLI